MRRIVSRPGFKTRGPPRFSRGEKEGRDAVGFDLAAVAHICGFRILISALGRQTLVRSFVGRFRDRDSGDP